MGVPGRGGTSKRFDRMKKLFDKELQVVIDAFDKNDQLSGAIHLHNNDGRLKNFLTNATGKSFVIEGAIVEQKEAGRIPF